VISHFQEHFRVGGDRNVNSSAIADWWVEEWSHDIVTQAAIAALKCRMQYESISFRRNPRGFHDFLFVTVRENEYYDWLRHNQQLYATYRVFRLSGTIGSRLLSGNYETQMFVTVFTRARHLSLS
jgi:hypothetical protein